MEVIIYVPTKLLTGILNTVEIWKPEGPGLGRARALTQYGGGRDHANYSVTSLGTYTPL